MQRDGCRFVARLSDDGGHLDLTRVGRKDNVASDKSSVRAFVDNNSRLELLAHKATTPRDGHGMSTEGPSISVVSIRAAYMPPLTSQRWQGSQSTRSASTRPFRLLSSRLQYRRDRCATVPNLMRLTSSRLTYGLPQCPTCLSHNDVRLVQLTTQHSYYAEAGSTYNNRFIPKILWAPPSINLPHLIGSAQAIADLMSHYVKAEGVKPPKYAVCSRCKLPTTAMIWQCLAPHCRSIWCNACASRTRHPRRALVATHIQGPPLVTNLDQRKAKCLQVIRWPGKTPFPETEEGRRLSATPNEVNRRVEFERWCDRQLLL